MLLIWVIDFIKIVFLWFGDIYIVISIGLIFIQNHYIVLTCGNYLIIAICCPYFHHNVILLLIEAT